MKRSVQGKPSISVTNEPMIALDKLLIQQRQIGCSSQSSTREDWVCFHRDCKGLAGMHLQPRGWFSRPGAAPRNSMFHKPLLASPSPSPAPATHRMSGGHRKCEVLAVCHSTHRAETPVSMMSQVVDTKTRAGKSWGYLVSPLQHPIVSSSGERFFFSCRNVILE